MIISLNLARVKIIFSSSRYNNAREEVTPMDLASMELAHLNAVQLTQLQDLEKKLNKDKQQKEIYLLALTRKG
jgi:FMN-dependent NADH-azoreductase